MSQEKFRLPGRFHDYVVQKDMGFCCLLKIVLNVQLQIGAQGEEKKRETQRPAR